MKFQEIAASDELTQLMVREVLSKSSLLANHIEFFKKPGAAVSVRTGGTTDGVDGQTRALNQDYSVKTVTPTYKTASRKMVGDKIQLDVALERMGFDLPSEMTAQLKRRCREMAYIFNYLIIKGDPATDAKQFAGLEQMVTQVRTLISGVNGMPIIMGNSDSAKKSQQGFLEKLDETIALCEGTNKLVVANAQILARLNSIAREYLTITKDEFGRPITLYNGTPLLNVGDYQKSLDTYAPILGFDQTVGTSSDCTSLYVASFEEEDGVSFATCDGGFTVYPIQKEGNFQTCTYELIADSVLVRASALSRLSGLKLS